MDNADKIMSELFLYINKYPILKFVFVIMALYFIFKFGKSIGEFIYYIRH